jgi:hypothetical protein
VSAVHDVIGSLVMTAKDHELIAKSLKSSASMYRKLAGNQRSRVRTDEDLEAAAVACDGAADGHTFRARELRYDANGGMTEELARRRFEPGARWSLYGFVVIVDQPVNRAELTRENGWLFLDLGDAAGGHAPTGGWTSG